MNHTLRIYEHQAKRRGRWLLTVCSCGEKFGRVNLDTVGGSWRILVHIQNRAIQDWQDHRRYLIPRIVPPAACTVHLMGGPKDGDVLMVPFELYRAGTLVVLRTSIPHWRRDPGDVVSHEQILYRRNITHPLIWEC